MLVTNAAIFVVTHLQTLLRHCKHLVRDRVFWMLAGFLGRGLFFLSFLFLPPSLSFLSFLLRFLLFYLQALLLYPSLALLDEFFPRSDQVEALEPDEVQHVIVL